MGHAPDHVVADDTREHEHGVVFNEILGCLGAHQQSEPQNGRGEHVFAHAAVFRLIHRHWRGCGRAGLGLVGLRDIFRRPVGFTFPRDEHAADDVILQIHVHLAFG